MQDLNLFELPNIVWFIIEPSGFTKMIIHNDLAQAEIYLYGANLTHFQPKGREKVIFDGQDTVMVPDKTLHAGIPICWPWFGPHPTDNTKPQHGFARTMLWRVKETKQLDSGETKIVLGLEETPESLRLFNYPFALELTFVIGEKLFIHLKSTNRSDKSFTFTQALHNYFSVSDIGNIVINGIENRSFIDLNDSERQKSESTPLKVDRILNRTYIPSNDNCEIVDTGLDRKVIIQKRGSNSTTIWNPGVDSGIHDLPRDTYRRFVCVETTNAREDSISLESGQSYELIQKIEI